MATIINMLDKYKDEIITIGMKIKYKNTLIIDSSKFNAHKKEIINIDFEQLNQLENCNKKNLKKIGIYKETITI
ncbi:hypothetical protein CLOACE_15030 [Clostridium acetireducens DSM 10703]|uniref:Uncharacterized protein n=1 Tax=Clostridium acetireducens DSM 10703 TaxID=1121290 RepID=A0A1E8EXY6_9CLOT|nr:hypothetical protein [Clostridium acetireducens]OFI05808.1 hypothetical protein CLOACE_15030 [Clostridium acetireducens DSM 10703]